MYCLDNVIIFRQKFTERNMCMCLDLALDCLGKVSLTFNFHFSEHSIGEDLKHRRLWLLKYSKQIVFEEGVMKFLGLVLILPQLHS